MIKISPNFLRNDFYKYTYKAFSKWIPKVPRHKIIIDKNNYSQPHAVWDFKAAEDVQVTHVEPKLFRDKIAYYLVKIMRISFDFFSGFRPGKMNETKYLRRCIFLETIAGVPGMIGGMSRHLRALRSLKNDGGWIHHLLEEAENERMHLLYFLRLRKPGFIMRVNIMIAQFIFLIYYILLYSLNSSTAHRFVGYLEEEAVKTYTNLIKELDEGKLPTWQNMPADEISISYWALPKDAKVRDVLLAIRADETFHREFNHHFADIPKDKPIENSEEIILMDRKQIQDIFKETEKTKNK